MSHQTLGCAYLLISVVTYTALGASYKLVDRLGCSRRQVNLFLFVFGGVVVFLWAWWTGGLEPIRPAMAIGAGIGAVTYVGVVAFRRAVSFGKIATPWTALQLSLVVPVLGSMAIWHEIPAPRHYAGFALTALAIVLLGADMGKTRR